MFGYIKVDRANLLGKEYDAYKGVYCALCKQLGKDYSVFARFILSYDCTFYAVLALDLAQEPPCYQNGRCRFNPLKKCLYAGTETEALSLAAALSVVCAYYKLRDNLIDSAWYKRFPYRLLQPFFARWRRKAVRRYPEIDRIVSDMMTAQSAAEKARDCSLDMAAAPTAIMLGEACALLTDYIPLRPPLQKESTKRILRAMGYFMGRWVYLTDAADDYEADIRRRNFNPFSLRDDADLPAVMEASLNHALSEALLSYGLLDKGRFDGVIQNVLTVSCVNIQKKIIGRFSTADVSE